MTQPTASQKDRGDLLLFALLGVAVVCFLIEISETMAVAGCGDQCNYDLLVAAHSAFLLTLPSVVVLTALVYVVFRPRSRRAWVIPTTGIGLVVILLVITVILVREAT